MKKTLWTLDIDYPKEITRFTHAHMSRYADKIGADFRIITKRRFPEWPVVYEKLQLFDLCDEKCDWNIFVDADALIHPDLFDVTEHLQKDTVLFYSTDIASLRFKSDDYFRRDGRSIAPGNWFTVASNWCLDLWRPLDDLSFLDAMARIAPRDFELKAGVVAHGLIDDFVLARNIAKYGLKVDTFVEMQKRLNAGGQAQDPDYFFYHNHLAPIEVRAAEIRSRCGAPAIID